MIKKTFALAFIFVYGFMFSQFSEIAEIDREVGRRYSEISKKYKRKHSPERLSEESEVESYRNEAYHNAIADIQKDEVKIDLNTIEKFPTKEAEFETGISGFRKLFSENFDTSMVDAKAGTLKSEIQFLIDENGIPSNVEAKGNFQGFNQQAILTFYSIINKGKWKPAEKNGIPVKSVFRLPITMQFR